MRLEARFGSTDVDSVVAIELISSLDKGGGNSSVGEGIIEGLTDGGGAVVGVGLAVPREDSI